MRLKKPLGSLLIAALALVVLFSFLPGLRVLFVGSAELSPSGNHSKEMARSQCVTSEPEIYTGCFTGNTPYHHTVKSLSAMPGFAVDSRSTRVAQNFWTQTLNTINARPKSAERSIFFGEETDPAYAVYCPLYGTCDAATTVTGKKIHLPAGAAPSSDSDHHLIAIDRASKQEIDMWGGGGGCYVSSGCTVPPGGPTYTFSNGVTLPVACQVGTYSANELTCSWGGVFPFSGDGRAVVAGHSGNAGDVAFGLMSITLGELMQGHIYHALGIIGQCLDDGGVYPGTVGRSSDYTCSGQSVNGRTVSSGPEPMPRYGEMLHLKASVNLDALPYSAYSQYCKVIVKALQEYGAYHDDNSAGYGISLIGLGFNGSSESVRQWNAIFDSMVAGGDASGDSTYGYRFKWCLQRIDPADLESIVISTVLPPKRE